jgi:L-aminopeptidase/D-esterase-like protein
LITDVRGISVGHWTDREGVTGCTVVLCPPGTVGAAEVRGGAPGTRGTESLKPMSLLSEIHAIVLSGGSAFGLAACTGVERWLEHRGVGFQIGPVKVPIVAGAILFDLAVGDPRARPGADAGYEACEAAEEGPVEEGSVGAGMGATVAKTPDPTHGWKGGIGTASERDGGAVVGALVAVNALGDIIDEDGSAIASNRSEPGAEPGAWEGANTTLVVVATNAKLDKALAGRLAMAAHDGLAQAIRPAHTLWDGDTAFAVATGEVDASQLWLERAAAATTAAGVRRGVRLATPAGGVPSVGEET